MQLRPASGPYTCGGCLHRVSQQGADGRACVEAAETNKAQQDMVWQTAEAVLPAGAGHAGGQERCGLRREGDALTAAPLLVYYPSLYIAIGEAILSKFIASCLFWSR